MKQILIITLFFLFPASLFGQAPTKGSMDSAKYLIIEATVEFLSTDTLFGRNNPTCKECKVNDYEILKNYAKKNKITGALDFINKWKAIEIDTAKDNWLQSINSFKSTVHDDIAAGEKERRQGLSKYNDYKTALDSIITTLSTADTAKKEPLQETKSEEAKEETKEPNSTFLQNILDHWLLYSVLVLLLSVIIVLLLKIKTKNRKIASLKHQSSKDKKEANASIENYKRQVDRLKEDIGTQDNEIEKLEEQLAEEREKNQLQSNPPIPQLEQQEITVPQTPSNIKYARYADQGNGFSVSELLPASDNETIFEITITSPNTAKFKISDNTEAQKYALSNAAYFLDTPCKYDSAPSGHGNIHTEQLGELKLQGNKWQIVSPAVISFK